MQTEGQDHLTVDIIDTGIGIPDEAKRRLFIAWYQAESFTARHYGGSGLGLYICNELVNAMQGRLSMESQVGKGSRFTFTVPVEPYGLTNSTQPIAEPVLPRFNHQISVLVVEDHPANQQVIAGQLDMLQCHYEMASEGEAAMNLLEDENYYVLILLDCNSPGRDGYQLTEDIRHLEQQRQLERTPIIAISALNSQAHYARCKLSGMDDVMTKPIVLPELADVLVKWCPEAASRAQYEMRQEPELTLQPAMKSWLMQDLADFRRAAEAEDLRFMTYSIHRIKGGAQMYHLPDLAEYSADIERQLHEAKGDENWPLAELAETRAAVRQVIPQVIASGFDGVILNITNPCDVITQIIQQTSGFPHSQVLGTGTSLDTARMKRVVGEFFGFDPKSVTGYVLGEHGESQFVAWSTVRLGGRPVAELAGDRDVDWAQMDDRVRGGGWDILQGKGWTSFGIATATARLVDVILSDANSVYPVSAWDENLKVYIGQPGGHRQTWRGADADARTHGL
ncbi:CheY-like chemotaxis protein [Ewingella americana]